jgi:hypothetical protein
MLLATALFVNRTAGQLPARVAVHFDVAGDPDGFMSSGQYRRFILFFAVGLPLILVALLTMTYSKSANLKIPNRDYWLAPGRIARTRAFLVAHGTWFGSLFAAMMCFTHWLVVTANRLQPPHLSNPAVYLGLFAFLACTLAWIATLMIALRLPKEA